MPKSCADALAALIAARSAAHDTLEYKGVPSTFEGIEARQGMETRRAEAENGLRALVADVIGGARVLQGGGNEGLEATLPARVKEAAGASLARLFPEFGDADDPRWSNAIERTRRGAEHPLEVLDHHDRTGDHPVCAAVLSFVGSGRKGREVRTHFSASPYGWPRDAIDAALISLFGAGHLRAVVNGVALRPPQLDQAKVPNTDFRVESATIDTRQRLKLRKLFQTTGVDCKPNEEAAAAGRLLARLHELAQDAGGDAPLPERPGTRHLSDLQALAGNEQLAASSGATTSWRELRGVEQGARPGGKTPARLVALAGPRPHGEGLAEAGGGAGRGERWLGCRGWRAGCGARGSGRHKRKPDAAVEVRPQIEAIAANRSLLAPTDPIPDLARKLADALRAAWRMRRPSCPDL